MPNNEKNNHICDRDDKGIKFILFKMEIPVAVITSMEIYLHFIYFSKHTYFKMLNEEKEHLQRFPFLRILLLYRMRIW